MRTEPVYLDNLTSSVPIEAVTTSVTVTETYPGVGVVTETTTYAQELDSGIPTPILSIDPLR